MATFDTGIRFLTPRCVGLFSKSQSTVYEYFVLFEGGQSYEVKSYIIKEPM